MSLNLSPKKIQTVALNFEKSAQLIELRHVSDSEPGITRKKKGTGFIYLLNKKQITDESELNRIRKLVIPPAWENVWVCKSPYGHLQATGLDSKKRKQYLYHPLWAEFRNQTKFYRLYEFGNILPKIREQIRKDLALTEMNEKKVMALILQIMDETGIRIGNEEYEKQNGSYGLTTLKNHHVTIQNGNTIRFAFRGKKGILQNITLRSKRIARMIKQCRELPGKELFEYHDEKGEIKKVDSGMVNNYIHEIVGENFTAKDFRTWTGSVHALNQLLKLETANNKAMLKKQLAETLDYVASQLGNTRAVCKKYYVHPVLFEWHENGTLKELCSNGALKSVHVEQLDNREKLLLAVLEKAMNKKISLN